LAHVRIMSHVAAGDYHNNNNLGGTKHGRCFRSPKGHAAATDGRIARLDSPDEEKLTRNDRIAVIARESQMCGGLRLEKCKRPRSMSAPTPPRRREAQKQSNRHLKQDREVQLTPLDPLRERPEEIGSTIRWRLRSAKVLAQCLKEKN
jgi:hypothetical protein